MVMRERSLFTVFVNTSNSCKMGHEGLICMPKDQGLQAYISHNFQVPMSQLLYATLQKPMVGN